MSRDDELAADRAHATKVRDVDRGVDQDVSRAMGELPAIGSAIEPPVTDRGFTEVWGHDVHPSWRGGIIRVTADITDGEDLGDLLQISYVDVRVVGFMGSRGETIHRAAVGRMAGACDVVIAAPQAYRRLAVLCRLFGLGSGVSTARASVVARFVRT